MTVSEVVEPVGRTIECLGVAVIALGVASALVAYGRALVSSVDGAPAHAAVRRDIGQGVLLGLEVLVAGDIIRTVAVDPSLTSVAVLGAIVVIRTFLSVAIDTEINGRWPWKPRRDESPRSTLSAEVAPEH
jgi:uncharacterized membrane protein